jgi:hypothetical protein
LRIVVAFKLSVIDQLFLLGFLLCYSLQWFWELKGVSERGVIMLLLILEQSLLCYRLVYYVRFFFPLSAHLRVIAALLHFNDLLEWWSEGSFGLTRVNGIVQTNWNTTTYRSLVQFILRIIYIIINATFISIGINILLYMILNQSLMILPLLLPFLSSKLKFVSGLLRRCDFWG